MDGDMGTELYGRCVKGCVGGSYVGWTLWGVWCCGTGVEEANK